jgi:hypothetical protein
VNSFETHQEGVSCQPFLRVGLPKETKVRPVQEVLAAAMDEAKPLKDQNGTKQSAAKEIMDLWDEKGLCPTTKYNGTILSALEKMMRGQILNHEIGYEKYWGTQFEPEVIITAIEHFAKAACDNDYKPTSAKTKFKYRKLPLHKWLFNPHADKVRSMFICFLEKPPTLIKKEAKLIPDINPELTSAIKEVFVSRVFRSRGHETWSNEHENDFRKASQRLHRFLDQENGTLPKGTDRQASWLINSIISNLESRGRNPCEVKPFWLHSDLTFDNLPSYLAEYIKPQTFHAYLAPRGGL